MVKTINIALLLACAAFGAFGSVTVYASAQVEQPNIVDSTAVLIGSIAAFAGAVGTLFVAIGPLVKKFSKTLGEGLEKTGHELIKSDQYLLTLAEQVKKNKATYEILKEAVLSSAHATPEQRAQLAEVEKKIQAAEAQIEKEIDRQREQLEKIHSVIPGPSITEEELEEEKRL